MTRTQLQRSVDVEAPVRAVYNQWTQFEEFPNFMGGIDAVKQIDDKRLHWRAHVGPKKIEWDAEIVEQRPDTLIAWRSTSGAENRGEVRFFPLGPLLTRVALAIEFSPEGFFELMGDALGAVARRVEGDLQRFKHFIEQRGRETGGWRGTIRGSAVGNETTSTDASADSSPASHPGVAFKRPPPNTSSFRVGSPDLGTLFPMEGSR